MSVDFLITLGVTIFCRSWIYSLSMNVRFWSELCVCMQVGTLFRPLRTVNKNTAISDKKKHAVCKQ